jgi:multidrug efflux pump subunit AcrB
VIHLDPDRLRAYGLSAMEVVEAINTTNTMSPSGNALIGKRMPTVALNSVVTDIRELGNVPVHRGARPAVFIRDVATIEDSSTIETGYALVGGRRTVYIPIAKRAEASTLTVVNSLKEVIPRFQAALPEDVKVSYQFDQSYFVTRSIDNLSMEGLMGAVLTGLMVLLFLQDWRSALVVIISIPLSLTCAIIGLWLTDQTINIMTLGGLALAVGVLVDEATVAIENIHAHLARGKDRGRAVLDASRETIIPRLLAMLSILAVFTPAFFMTGATRAMFVPLALAVGFSMVASYFISSTVVPILACWLLKVDHAQEHHEPAKHSRFSFVALQSLYSRVLGGVTKYRVPVIAAYLLVAVAVIILLGRQVGTEIFPQSDEGQLTLRFRAAEGTRIEETEKTAARILGIIQREAGPDNVDTTLGYVGTQSSDHPINAIYLWTGGPEEGVLQVQMRHGWGVPIEHFKETLRGAIGKELPGVRLSFEPSDIVSRVMSFGTSTPMEIAVTGPDLAANRKTAEQLMASLKKIGSLRDLQIGQSLDYPAVKIRVDREKAGLLGLSMDDVSNAFVPATSTSRYIYKNLWPDPRTGVTYFVEVEVPEESMNSIEELRNIPLGRGPHSGPERAPATRPMLMRDIAKFDAGTVLGEYDRYNLQRTVTITANISGEDLGRVSKAVNRAVKEIGEPPRGVAVAVRGQVSTMEQIFEGLRSGLVVTVVAIFFLLAANFQSWKLAFVIVSTVPAVLAGVVVMLFSTGTTLNIQSFMGCIMSVGVAVANAILLITFAERYRREGMTSEQAAIEGARGRLRPILMTSFAMVAGMIPMALGLSEGGSQAAPLGRAVIGGLAVATAATLFILPAVFASVQRKASGDSPSLDPNDLESKHYAPAPESGT